MRRLLRSTAIILALGFFIPAPSPLTGIVFNRAAYADPYTARYRTGYQVQLAVALRDSHKLRADQIHRISDEYYEVDGYSSLIPDAKVKPSKSRRKRLDFLC